MRTLLISIFQLSKITALTDVDNKILAVFGDSTATHTKPGKLKDPAGLSSTKLGSNFLSVGLVIRPLQTQSIISSETRTAQMPHF